MPKPANTAAPIPDWLKEMDAQEAMKAGERRQQPTPVAPATPANTAAPIPDWLKEMDAQEAMKAGDVQPDNRPMPSWYIPEPETVTSEAVKPDTTMHDVLANASTGVARVPGAIIGLPHMIGHTLNWTQAQMDNALNYFFNSKAPHETGADLDKRGLVHYLPSAQDVDNVVFKGISAVAGRPVEPYEPTSFFGKLGQAAVTGALGGVVDPVAVLGGIGRGASVGKAIVEGSAKRAAQTAVAADAANATQQAFPDSPGVAAAAALAAHGATSGLEAAARAGGGVAADAARQVFRPGKQGGLEAGRVLGRVDNNQPGLASPQAPELTAAGQAVKAATDDIGVGLPDHMAGANLRAGLQTRADALKAARSAATDKAFDAFRAQPPLPAVMLEPFMRSPSFRKAIGAANGAVLDEGGEPLTRFFDFTDDVPAHLTGDAIPPDVLHRVKSQLSDSISAAPGGSQAERTASMLHNRFTAFLDELYPAEGDFPGYAAIRKGYADASRPLDPLAHGPVDKVLNTEKQFGQSRYTFFEERIPDLFLRSNATRSDLNQLVEAFGGDKTAALSGLQDHLAGVAQKAVNADGTLDAAAFAKVMQPYEKSVGNLGVWFPQLAGKFKSAKAAQDTLDTMREQRSIADAIAGGALRDHDGAVTGQSLDNWVRANRDALSRTQSPAAVMRLQNIARAINETRPGELADAIKSELLPAAIGTALGGLEGGVLGIIAHKTASFTGQDAKRLEAFSSAIERAATDPAYAERLAAGAAKARSAGLSPKRSLVRAIAATPMAVNAGTR
jgi:hypothetical protein